MEFGALSGRQKTAVAWLSEHQPSNGGDFSIAALLDILPFRGFGDALYDVDAGVTHDTYSGHAKSWFLSK